MSHYSEVCTVFKSEEDLVEALIQMGFKREMIKVFAEPQFLRGWRGDKRQQKAHIIIPKEFVGSASNDLGFEKLADGTYKIHVSDYDIRIGYGAEWVGKLEQHYAAIRGEKHMKLKGWRVKKVPMGDGIIRHVYVK